MAPPDRFVAAASAYRGEGAPWLVLTASYYERFLDHPDQAPERAAFFRDLLEGRGGYTVAARFRQSGWRRPPAEFLDPEIVVLKKEAAPGAGSAPDAVAQHVDDVALLRNHVGLSSSGARSAREPVDVEMPGSRISSICRRGRSASPGSTVSARRPRS